MSQRIPGAGKPQVLPGGEYTYTTPPVPTTREGFLNGHITDRADQFWWHPKVQEGDRRDCWELLGLPSDEEFDQLPEHEKGRLMVREFERRETGVWFLNDGQPTYLTGRHYYYLTCYHLDIGLPKFRQADVWVFYVLDLRDKDPKCYGTLLITRRRYGKSYIGGVDMLEPVTRSPEKHGGMQSKTDEDASKLFQRAIVRPWQRLPAWARPLDNMQSSAPTKELRFSAPTKRMGKAKEAKRVVALNSWIDFSNSKDNAYDGEKLFIFLSDEIFKAQTNDPVQRWSVVRKMLKEEGVAIGKSLHTSSVEEIEDDGASRARSMWNDSAPDKKDELGETPSGLNRIFVPAYWGYKVDKYGRDLPEGKQELDAQRRRVQHDPVKLMSECRANPYTIEEALRGAGRESLLNLTAIHTAQDALAELKGPALNNLLLRCDLTWEDWNDRRVVKTVENRKNGRFLIAMPALPGPQQLNLATDAGTVSTINGFTTRWKPTQDALYAIGTDPFDKKTALLAAGKGSNAAAYVYRKHDTLYEAQRPDYDPAQPAVGWPTNGLIVQYINRPELPSVFYEDMVMLCHLFGCSILYENQKDKILDHFINRGYEDFIANKPKNTAKAATKKEKDTPGIAATEETIGEYYERIMEFTFGPLAEDWRRCPFAELLQDWLDFEIDNTKKYDAAVASGYTFMQARRYIKKAPTPINMADLSLRNFYNL